MSLVIVVDEGAAARERYVAAVRQVGFDALSAANLDQAKTLIDLLPSGGATLRSVVLGAFCGRGLLSFMRNKLALPELHVEEHRSLASVVMALEAATRRGASRPVVHKLYTTNDQLVQPRERPEELRHMFQHFLRSYSLLEGKNVRDYSDAALERLCAHAWPGGVHQVRDTVAALVEMSTGDRITLRELSALGETELLTFSTPIGTSIRELNRRYTLLVLEAVGGNKCEAARVLDIGAKTLSRWMSQWSKQDDSDRGVDNR